VGPTAANGLMTVATVAVGWPSSPVVRYSTCSALYGVGAPPITSWTARALSTVPGVICANGVDAEYV
jgi:hypothetical protein